MNGLLFIALLAPGEHPQDGPDADLRIRIDAEAVTYNITMNLAFLDEIVETGREDLYSLHPVEYEGVHQELFAYLKEHNKVKVDGVEVTPKDVEFEVQQADLSLLPLFPNEGTRALIKVRIKLEYSVKSPPKRVDLRWPAYPPDTIIAEDGKEPPPLEVTAQLIADGVQEPVIFKKDEPEYTWHAPAEGAADRFLEVPRAVQVAPLKVPALSAGLVAGLLVACGLFLRPGRPRARRALGLAAPLVLVGAVMTSGMAEVEVNGLFGGGQTLPDEAEALAVFLPMHANIYRAFDFVEESDVYDALARSVEGDLLDSLYREIFQSLIMKEEGGAVCRVEEVRPIETKVSNVGEMESGAVGFTVDHRWQVDGAVYHSGHSHYRTNEYRARYNVVSTADGWRIAGSQIEEQFRVDATPIPPGEDL